MVTIQSGTYVNDKELLRRLAQRLKCPVQAADETILPGRGEYLYETRQSFGLSFEDLHKLLAKVRSTQNVIAYLQDELTGCVRWLDVLHAISDQRGRYGLNSYLPGFESGSRHAAMTTRLRTNMKTALLMMKKAHRQ